MNHRFKATEYFTAQAGGAVPFLSASTLTEKNTLRRQLRDARRNLSHQQQRHAARALCRQLNRYRGFHKARKVAFYLANDGEIDLHESIQLATKLGKSCFLPRLTKNDHMLFAPYRIGQSLVRNRYGIPEPVSRWPNLVLARQLDLIIMPLVGFDLQGNRLGMGGGYYDRSLAFKRRSRVTVRPRLVGVAHEIQRVEHLNPESWDVPMDAVITDAGRYCPRSRRC